MNSSDVLVVGRKVSDQARCTALRGTAKEIQARVRIPLTAYRMEIRSGSFLNGSA